VHAFFLDICPALHTATRCSVFKEFGEIVEIVILRDRRSGMHQGCCFVKYAALASAQIAIQVLHNQRSLSPLRNPLQVRLADSGGNGADRGQTNAENKLFIGGVPVGCGDKELRLLFSNYGEVQDVYMLASKSSQEGQRGCAFVRYATPQSCADAIEALHGKYAMKAGELPLVVRFADPPKSQRVQSGVGLYDSARSSWSGAPPLWAGGTGSPPGWPMTWGSGAMAGCAPWVMSTGMQACGMIQGGDGLPAAAAAGEPQRALPMAQQPPLPMKAPPATCGGWSEHQAPGGLKYYYHLRTSMSMWNPPAEIQSVPCAQPPQLMGMGSMPNISQFTSMSAISIVGQQMSSTAVPNKRVSEQPLFSATSAAPSLSSSMSGYLTRANNNVMSNGLIKGSFQDATTNGCATLCCSRDLPAHSPLPTIGRHAV